MGRPKGSKNKIKINKDSKSTKENNVNISNFNVEDLSFLTPIVVEMHESISERKVLIEDPNIGVNKQAHIKPTSFIKREPKIKIQYSGPETFLKSFFSTKLVGYIQDQTNESIKILQNIREVSKSKIAKFLGVSILMGIYHLPNLKMYWDSNNFSNLNIKNEFMVNTMSDERFVFIRNHLRLTEYIPDKEKNFKLIQEKTENIMNAINKMFGSVFVPNQNIYIDETTIGFKGNFKALVYNPKKPD